MSSIFVMHQQVNRGLLFQEFSPGPIVKFLYVFYLFFFFLMYVQFSIMAFLMNFFRGLRFPIGNMVGYGKSVFSWNKERKEKHAFRRKNY